MRSIENEITNEIIINKSRFITILIPISDVNLVNNKIDMIKKKYACASHYCYGYIIESSERCSDDKEPSGTAGMPILNVLKKNNLTNVLCVVVRYFGGVKLGASGLLRAYSSSVKVALKKGVIGEIKKGYLITIEFNYDNIKDVDYLLKNIKCEKHFDKNIIYVFSVLKDEYENIEKRLNYLCKSVTIKEITMIKSKKL